VSDALLPEGGIDSLTRLYNVQFLHKVLAYETARADRYEVHLTMLLIDVNHLRQVNEVHGRDAGDKVLKDLGGVLQSTVRNVDFVFRFGGDEFAIVLPHTDLHGSSHVRRRIMDRLEPFDLPSKLGAVNITVTIAASEYRRGSHFETLIREAEVAMMKAKGRDGDDTMGVPAYV